MIKFFSKMRDRKPKCSPHKVLFLTTNDFGFGGSEDLWTLTALRMANMGYQVGISLRGWNPEPQVIKSLAAAGCAVFRRSFPPNKKDYFVFQRFRPQLVVISQGSNFESINWMRVMNSFQQKYINIIHCVHEACWPGVDDALIDEANFLYSKSMKLFFVSEGNLNLHQKMCGVSLNNAEILRNPFKVPYNAVNSYPSVTPVYNVAFVGRLECFHKGLDLLLEVLKQEKWKRRNIHFNIYGQGPHKHLLERLQEKWSITNITFHGHMDDIVSIWSHNHALIQPSRLEGLPLTVVEAMLCNRLAIVTDVAGHKEVVDDGETGFLAKAPAPEFIDEALEKAWSRRIDWQQMGLKAGIKIKTLVPNDPVGLFIDKISSLMM